LISLERIRRVLKRLGFRVDERSLRDGEQESGKSCEKGVEQEEGGKVKPPRPDLPCD
jgi:hypothetical protein